MSKGADRRFTAEQKLGDFARSGATGRHVSAVSVARVGALGVYRWRAVADTGSAAALKRDAKRRPRRDDVEARQKAQIERLRTVVAEITSYRAACTTRGSGGRTSPTGR
jgi:hypothetical protein